MEGFSILNLNDDCLEHICKYLHLDDQMNFAMSCRRFHDVFAILFKVTHKHFHTGILENLSQFQTKTLLQIVGSHFRTLIADFSSDEVGIKREDELIVVLSLFLTNVEKLKIIENCQYSSPSKLIENMPQLQELELFSSRFDDDFIKYLKEFRNLSSLTIVVNMIINGSDIQNLLCLEKLTLYHCPEIFPNICNIFKSLKKLHYLDIRCQKIDNLLGTLEYECIAKHQQQLKTLKIALNKGNFYCLTKLPNLKKLELRCSLEFNSPIDKFFQNLAKFKADQLEDLAIYTFDMNLEAVGAIANLKTLKNLMCDFSVNDKFLELLSHLVDLQEIVLPYTTACTEYGFSKLLENCRNLKQVSWMCLSVEKRNLIARLHKVIKELHARHRLYVECYRFLNKTLNPDARLEKCDSEDEAEYDDE